MPRFSSLPARLATLLFCAGIAMASTIASADYNLVDAPKELPDFLLFNQDFKPLRRQDLQGQWTLLYFGYMNCPDVCPTTLSHLSRVMKSLKQSDVIPLPRVLFVSVDPWRDTPQKLKEYVRYFDPSFLAASADTPQLNILTNALQVIYYNNRNREDSTDYAVSHSDAVFLLDPLVRLRGYFKAPLNDDEMTRVLERELKPQP